jgi:hypothetical protein
MPIVTGSMIVGGAMLGSSALSGYGASKSAKAANKLNKKLLWKMEAVSKRYPKYAKANRAFYNKEGKNVKKSYYGLADQAASRYNKLANTTRNAYSAEADKQQAMYDQYGAAAYNNYYDSAAQDLRNTGYAGMMNILNNPSGVRDDAAYKFMQSEAETSTSRAAGARGMGNSSNVLNALQERRLNVADTYLNSIMNRYGSAYGLGEDARTKGLDTQNQWQQAGATVNSNMNLAGLDWQARMKSAGTQSFLGLKDQGLQGLYENRRMGQVTYQNMLDNGANIAVGQGAQQAYTNLANTTGASDGAGWMTAGNALSTAGSLAMMYGFGSGGSGGGEPVVPSGGGQQYGDFTMPTTTAQGW